MPIFDFLNDPRRRRLAEQGLAGGDDMAGSPDAPVVLPARPPWTPGAVTAMGGNVMVPEKPAGLPGGMTGTPPPSMGLGRPSSLPEAPPPMPALTGRIPGGAPPSTLSGPRPETVDNSGVGVPLPPLSGNGPPTPYSPEAKARYDYVMENAKRNEAGDLTGGFKRSRGDIAKSALTGFLQGIGSGGGLAGGIGGALSGGAYGAINPRGARESLFDQTVAPKLQRDAAMAEQQRQQARQGRLDTQNDRYKEAQITNIGAETEYKRSEAEKNRLPVLRPTPAPQRRLGINRQTDEPDYYDVNNPEERKIFKPYIRETPKTPAAPTAAELATDPESGMSWEEMADASYEARGGDQYVFNNLPPRTKQLLDKGTITNADGKELNADPAEIRAAERAYQSAVSRQRQTDKEYSRGAVRSRRLGGAKNATSPQGGKKAATQSGSRNLKDLTNLWK